MLASLTDSLHVHQAPWLYNRVQVFAPRTSAKRLPRQQLRVVKPSPPSPAAVLVVQHHRALLAALAFKNQVWQQPFMHLAYCVYSYIDEHLAAELWLTQF